MCGKSECNIHLPSKPQTGIALASTLFGMFAECLNFIGFVLFFFSGLVFFLRLTHTVLLT